ncbi:MAG: type II secretion system protein GspK [Verrucomicrobiota bacterium]|nr:type II secretion system protein GspK [Verrucomicrobiota bacterium]
MGRRRGAAAARDGSALIVVVWVVSLLAMVVSSFAFEAFVEAKITTYYRNRLKTQCLARSGVEIAKMLMTRSDELTRKQTDMTEKSRWYSAAKNLSDGLAVCGLTEPLGDGAIVMDIVPEPARRNVNLLRSEDDWERVLAVGDITEDLGLWPVLIESFLDWTDADSTPRRDGAETDDHYATLTPPYRVKNGPLDTVEELLLIRGWKPVLLFGGVLNTARKDEEPIRISGIGDLLTTYGDGKVNVNAASRRALMTLPGIDDATADFIIAEREAGQEAEGAEKPDTSFQSVSDFFARVPGLEGATLTPHITTGSKIFRITSVGTVGAVKNTVSCIVSRDGKNMKILRWREE